MGLEKEFVRGDIVGIFLPVNKIHICVVLDGKKTRYGEIRCRPWRLQDKQFFPYSILLRPKAFEFIGSLDDLGITIEQLGL